ncbi:hypothetical protein BDD12DRAFT_829040 [Trichophaea hybrida]|nr:hypothetical protein BDD12DRAFT_829040 [Trichophaea hybrida]
MHDRGGTSHLLQQIPLTASPLIQLPTAVTLPYSYQSLPLGLPHPSTAPVPPANGEVPLPEGAGYITSPSGNVSQTPEAIIHSCHALIQYLQSQKSSAEQAWRDWEKSIEDRDLMEKRRVAPGYLDTGIQILEPTRKAVNTSESEPQQVTGRGGGDEQRSTEAGDELDRVFGKMAM